MIEASGVSLKIDQQKILDNVSLTIREKRVAIIGANGSGKTSFVRCLNGLITPDEGLIRVGGLDTKKDIRAIRRKIGFVFQNAAQQFIYPVVSEEIGFALQVLNKPTAMIKEKTNQLLEQFGLVHLRDKPVHNLSGGEQKMVSLLSVMISEPDYLILDEPTTFLDHRQKRQFLEIIDELPQTVILITHDFGAIMQYQRVIAFDQGKVVLDGEAAHIVPQWLELHG